MQQIRDINRLAFPDYHLVPGASVRYSIDATAQTFQPTVSDQRGKTYEIRTTADIYWAVHNEDYDVTGFDGLTDAVLWASEVKLVQLDRTFVSAPDEQPIRDRITMIAISATANVTISEVAD